ncbi:MAG: nuclear transport factor 2 family protein [Acidobacteriota bacterium]|nr:nuclear transport factor 2 family protein [Acidobacteriota bacterium]
MPTEAARKKIFEPLQLETKFMKENIRTNTENNSPETQDEARLAWVKNIFANADKLDLNQYLASFTDDARFQVGSEPPAVGRAAIEQAGGNLFSSVKAMKHNFVEVWLEENVAIIEATVEYTRFDERVVPVPCVTILRTENDLIKDARVFMDISPVFAA